MTPNNAKNNKPEARRILVLRYRFIGDTILTVPFLRNLRQNYPDAIIDVLVGPQSGTVLEGCPYVNELIYYDTTRFHKYDRGAGQKRSFLSYVFELRKRKYDTVFLLKRSLSSAILSLLIGAKNRIGYDTEGRRLLLTHVVPFNDQKHEVESTLDVLRSAGIEIQDKALEAWISPQERQEILASVKELSTKNLKVLFHAAAAHPDKLYPLESWAELMKTLAAKQPITPFFIGSKEDIPTYEVLQTLSGIKGVCLAGQLSLRQSMALLAEMQLAICTDSGPAHLAAAVGTPTISLFGPTDPERWRPWGEAHKAIFDDTLACRPCHYKKTCEDRPCLTALAPQKILEQAEAMLAQNSNKIKFPGALQAT